MLVWAVQKHKEFISYNNFCSSATKQGVCSAASLYLARLGKALHMQNGMKMRKDVGLENDYHAIGDHFFRKSFLKTSFHFHKEAGLNQEEFFVPQKVFIYVLYPFYVLVQLEALCWYKQPHSIYERANCHSNSSSMKIFTCIFINVTTLLSVES